MVDNIKFFATPWYVEVQSGCFDSTSHYSPWTRPTASFSALLFRLHAGATSIPSSSSCSPCSFVLCTVVGLCSAGLYTVYRIKGVGPVLTNWCCVPAGTMIKSPALTSWSLPAIVARPFPLVNVKIWSTVCFCKVLCQYVGCIPGIMGLPRHQYRRQREQSLALVANINLST